MERNLYSPPAAPVADPVETEAATGERPAQVTWALRLLWASVVLGGIDLLQQTLAAGRGHDATTTTLEQRRTQRLLHFLHLMRKAGRADVHRACSTVEAAVAAHGLHQHQVAE